ncbi:hypothetical protein AMS68_002283 [Peltaster fructicola]|uniref:RING-type domain-containing protein n=1 Tax=Peltaster fructicola TaxID=286661 RepID=A0A6H0XPZ9_9PEZI|nr:hypothetical protein AMS68_002283 [Peltaster fructicola]
MSLPPPSIPGWENPPNLTKSEDFAEDLCGICHGAFNDPHKAACGHMFCKHCIVEWYQIQLNPTIQHTNDLGVTCPFCREVFYMAQVAGNSHGLHFLHVPMLLRRSGLLDGTYTAGAGLQMEGVTTAAWQDNVHNGIDFLLRGTLHRLADALVQIVSADSARDAVIVGNLIRVFIQHRSPSFSQMPNFAKKWDYIVGIFARILLTDWPPIRTTSDELRQYLSHDLLERCKADEHCLLERVEGHALFSQRGSSRIESVSLTGQMISYVCSRACQRSLRSWIASPNA